MRITIEFDDNDMLCEAFEKKLNKTFNGVGLVNKSDCSFDLSLIDCIIYEAERRINGSTRYSILPDMISFKDKKNERRNKI